MVQAGAGDGTEKGSRGPPGGRPVWTSLRSRGQLGAAFQMSLWEEMRQGEWKRRNPRGGSFQVPGERQHGVAAEARSFYPDCFGRTARGRQPDPVSARWVREGGLPWSASKRRRNRPRPGHPQGRQALPPSRDAPPRTQGAPRRRHYTWPAAASPLRLPVTSQGGHPHSRFTKEETGAQRRSVTSLRPHSKGLGQPAILRTQGPHAAGPSRRPGMSFRNTDVVTLDWGLLFILPAR